ncbi:hypothetical protein Ddye_015450 [Dipteronia dyeriana]|uniref:Transposase n=1 Tax=Dipteronia dyeriana TaxID=168575 RepID=A0AAD9U5N5_9ROSI|nr:hypothetical protein Ddye_015450 [Dipteronia dyeriana]
MHPKDIIADMKKMYDIQFLYSKAHQALQYELSLTYGTHEEAFKLLPLFGYVLEQQIPGTITDLQYDENGRFLYFFMSLGASLIGFRRCIRLVIAVDGTHLKGRFVGIMFVATARDGNEQVYPIAFGYGHPKSPILPLELLTTGWPIIMKPRLMQHGWEKPPEWPYLAFPYADKDLLSKGASNCPSFSNIVGLNVCSDATDIILGLIGRVGSVYGLSSCHPCFYAQGIRRPWLISWDDSDVSMGGGGISWDESGVTVEGGGIPWDDAVVTMRGGGISWDDMGVSMGEEGVSYGVTTEPKSGG